MSRRQLQISLKLWQARLAYRERRHRFYHTQSDRPEAERRALATKWHKLADEARAMVARREAQLRELEAAPKVITQNLSFTNVFGGLGTVKFLTAHHSAGPVDLSDEHAKSLNAQYHRDHANKGWGGIGYHYNITRNGTIIRLRPKWMKGAHVGGWNTGNLGVMFHGNYETAQPNAAQLRSYRWLVQQVGNPARRGHKDWSGHASNLCPGRNLYPNVTA
jgi:hypothetical protein